MAEQKDNKIWVNLRDVLKKLDYTMVILRPDGSAVHTKLDCLPVCNAPKNEQYIVQRYHIGMKNSKGREYFPCDCCYTNDYLTERNFHEKMAVGRAKLRTRRTK